MTLIASYSESRKELFNRQAFEARLKDGAAPIACFKDAIRATRAELDRRYRSKGRIEAIIQDQAWFIDQILMVAWQRYDWVGADDLCLLAVGGYGRGELHPYSDIDIQILLGRDNLEKYQANIEKFLMFLWDINLEVGQSVRTIK